MFLRDKMRAPIMVTSSFNCPPSWKRLLQKGQPSPRLALLCFLDSISVDVMAISSLRTAVARRAVRLTNAAVRFTGRGSGTVAGGHVGLRIDPQLLGKLSRGRTVILVSGTNGKTTTSALVRAGWGGVVASNDTGANMPAGHVAALVSSTASAVVLEVDEAWLDVVVAATAPKVVVLLNLSRDQLDRASEVRQLAQRWRDMVAAHPDVAYVANASDPMVAYAVDGAPLVSWVEVPRGWREDARSCPRCTALLTFDTTWHCTCGFAQPLATTSIDERGEVVLDGAALPLALGLPGFFNRVNAAFAVRALSLVGVAPEDAAARVAGVSAVQGRYGLRQWRGRTVRLLLAKNPAGVGALIDEFLTTKDELWVALNARVADGRDPSWIYDAPFELLEGRAVWCLGDRRLDMATRLHYANVTTTVVDRQDDLPAGTTPVTVIANYTAFREIFEASTPC